MRSVPIGATIILATSGAGGTTTTVIGTPSQSRLLTKPLTLNVLHGGGVVFADQSDANAKLIAYWIGRPMPQGQDEFSNASDTMFTPPNPATGACNTQ